MFKFLMNLFKLMKKNNLMKDVIINKTDFGYQVLTDRDLTPEEIGIITNEIFKRKANDE